MTRIVIFNFTAYTIHDHDDHHFPHLELDTEIVLLKTQIREEMLNLAICSAEVEFRLLTILRNILQNLTIPSIV